MTRKAYPSDVSNDERAFVASCLTLMREDALQREHSLREVFKGLRHIVHTGMQSRMMLTTCRCGMPCISRRSAS